LHSLQLYPVIYGPKISHYVVNPTRSRSVRGINVLISFLIAILSAIILQMGLEMAGVVPPTGELLAPHMRYKTEQFLVNSIIFNPLMLPADRFFPWVPLEENEVCQPDLSEEPLTAVGEDEHVVLREVNGEIIKDVHTDSEAAEQQGTRWEDLSIQQRELWKAKLKETGAYVAGQGETIFKGIFFSELAGAVGRAVAG